MSTPPNYNNGESAEELSFASSGTFQHYRFGSVSPGEAEELSFASFQHYRFGSVSPGEAEELFIFGKLVNVPEKAVYYQRVYDATLGWCYYTTRGAPDSNPAAALTSPIHTGNISDSQILNITGIPER